MTLASALASLSYGQSWIELPSLLPSDGSSAEETGAVTIRPTNNCFQVSQIQLNHLFVSILDVKNHLNDRDT